MLSLITLFSLSFNINIINIPFDRGANKEGSKHAFNILEPHLDFLKINEKFVIDSDKGHIREILGDGALKCWKTLNENKFPLLIGGDHTTAVSSIFSSNEYADMNKKTLGVLWFDAHADFNTIQSSPSGNIHGTPVAILCGHTLPILSYGKYLDPSQFAYYGIRDIDIEEQNRMDEYNMKVLKQENDLENWIKKFDAIHLSFDMDCLDASDFTGVNTPVKDGPSYKNIKTMLQCIKDSGKMISMDLVEYNPTQELYRDEYETILDIFEILLT